MDRRLAVLKVPRFKVPRFAERAGAPRPRDAGGGVHRRHHRAHACRAGAPASGASRGSESLRLLRGRGIRRASRVAEILFRLAPVPVLGDTVFRLRNPLVERSVFERCAPTGRVPRRPAPRALPGGEPARLPPGVPVAGPPLGELEIPGNRSLVAPGAGHFLSVEAPGELVEAVTGFAGRGHR